MKPYIKKGMERVINSVVLSLLSRNTGCNLTSDDCECQCHILESCENCDCGGNPNDCDCDCHVCEIEDCACGCHKECGCGEGCHSNCDCVCHQLMETDSEDGTYDPEGGSGNSCEQSDCESEESEEESEDSGGETEEEEHRSIIVPDSHEEKFTQSECTCEKCMEIHLAVNAFRRWQPSDPMESNSATAFQEKRVHDAIVNIREKAIRQENEKHMETGSRPPEYNRPVTRSQTRRRG